MAISILSTWLIGGLDGYASKDGGLPPNIVGSTIAVSSTLALLSSTDNISEYINEKPLSVVMGTTVMFGSLFFMGYQLGRAIRMIKDNDESKDDEE
jgi:hypothetical protein